MAVFSKPIFVYLVIALSLTLSGCGSSQSKADQACAAYKNGDYETAKSAFASLTRENPSYQEQLEQIEKILLYKAELERPRDINESAEEVAPGITKGDLEAYGLSDLDAYEYGNNRAIESLDLFCS